MMRSRFVISLVPALAFFVVAANSHAAEFLYSRTIQNPTTSGSDLFGANMDLAGNTLLISAEGEAAPVSGVVNAGAAYVFDVVSGALARTFTEPAPGHYRSFGRSVAISGNTAVIGTSRNVAYRFDTGSGSSVTLAPPAVATYFGGEHAVAVSGSNPIVTARGDDNQANNAGRVYRYNAAGAYQGFINNPSTVPYSTYGNAAYDYFGTAIDATGSRILVGASQDDPGAGNAGSAFLFDAAGTPLRTFNNPYPAVNDRFGFSVALSDDYVLIGDRNNSGSDVGIAYLYNHSGSLLRVRTIRTPVHRTCLASPWRSPATMCSSAPRAKTATPAQPICSMRSPETSCKPSPTQLRPPEVSSVSRSLSTVIIWLSARLAWGAITARSMSTRHRYPSRPPAGSWAPA